MRNNHRSLVPSISDPVPILQPPTATVSEYAKKIEILANDLANGSAMTPEINGAGKEFSFYFLHSSPRRLAGEKKFHSYNHKTTIWVSHEYYLNPEFFKILSRAF